MTLVLKVILVYWAFKVT